MSSSFKDKIAARRKARAEAKAAEESRVKGLGKFDRPPKEEEDDGQPVLGNFKSTRTRTRVQPAGADDGEASFAPAATQPKVMVPYDPRPGHPPRQVEIERRRRLYASEDVNELLKELGVDYDKWTLKLQGDDGETREVSLESKLSLQHFDNMEFETFLTPQEWLARGIDPLDGKQKGLPCKALSRAYKQGEWRAGIVMGYSPETDLWEVAWRASGTS